MSPPRAGEYENLRFERPAGHVARVVLDRPAAANALNSRLFSELADVLERIAADDEIRVWLLTGADRPDGRPCFSAGADLREAAAGNVRWEVDPAAVVDRIDAMFKPSIAAIGGICTTGGLELALACDLRVAARSAQLSDRHLERSGLAIGAWGLAARLSRLVGTDKAKELLLLGSEIDGAEAARIGLVNRVVDDPELAGSALAMAATIASRPRRGVRATLGYLALSAEMSTRDAMRWGQLTPELMGLQLRPFSDAASRYYADRLADPPQ